MCAHLISLARKNFDLVILDLPSALTGWSDAILNEVDIYFAVLELEMRSAQNALRFARLVRGEGLPIDRVKFILNRAPGLTDLNGKSRIKRLAESLDVSIKTLLPDGGKQVAGACDQGEPLAIGRAKIHCAAKFKKSPPAFMAVWCRRRQLHRTG
jgi:pilus assembly protein CpaE